MRRSRLTVLARWAWLAEETQGDEGAAKLQEGQMDVSPVPVADLQAPEAVEPGERPFDHLPVASQAVLGLDTTAGDAGDDAALAQGQTEVTVVVTLVGMERSYSASLAAYATVLLGYLEVLIQLVNQVYLDNVEVTHR